ncbi:OadG family protein [Aliivibrio kagoshimensis]|uniref:OadG family protein n=1 Tax=Aliivibrio kagoshimensis TaxID=2910230 RepID=UPI003D0D81B6
MSVGIAYSSIYVVGLFVASLILLVGDKMEQSSLFLEGVNLMMLGMGFVATFLTLLVGATTVMSRVAQRFVVPVEPKPSLKQPKTQSTDDTTLVAVLTAAIHHHKKSL